MGVFHQMGHLSKNLLLEEDLLLFKGAILSPVNEDFNSMNKIIQSRRDNQFEMIFDPKIYYPPSHIRYLSGWEYFPDDNIRNIREFKNWQRSKIEILKRKILELQPDSVLSPAYIPSSFSDEYYHTIVDLRERFSNQLSVEGINIIQTLIVNLSNLTDMNRVAEIASICSSGTCKRAFLILISNIPPRYELDNFEEIFGAIKLINYLEQAEIRVIVGFSSSDIILWKYAGASDCSSGKFFSLRRFTLPKIKAQKGGGGQVPYWFEESLMAFIREQDLIKITKAGILSPSSIRNPYGNRILHSLHGENEPKWLSLSWRQYLYWFADFEMRFVKGLIDSITLLSNAQQKWNRLRNENILMEEYQNNGEWIQVWLRALTEFKKIKLEKKIL